MHAKNRSFEIFPRRRMFSVFFDENTYVEALRWERVTQTNTTTDTNFYKEWEVEKYRLFGMMPGGNHAGYRNYWKSVFSIAV
jgi:hypothetical protein